MKQLLVAGALACFGVFAACGESDASNSRRGGSGPTGGSGEGGENPGGSDGLGGSGTGGSTGGSATGGLATGGRGGTGVGGGSGAGVTGGAGASGSAGVSGASGAGGSAGSGAIVPCGSYDCAKLPHVRPGAAVECRGGGCYIPPDGCVEGFAHCSSLVSVGCEADLSTPETCGSCSLQCQGDTPLCAQGTTGRMCVTRCMGASPDLCGGFCTNVDSDPRHCGNCSTDCTNKGIGNPDCVDGVCTGDGCLPGLGDCDAEVGCETDITTAENCGACGRNTCGAANATPDCSSPSACAHPICDPGYGNCEPSNPDCEATYGAACFPHYDYTRRLALEPWSAAVTADGSTFLAGAFPDVIDFDMTVGVDRIAPVGEADCYITRFEANGTYAWTRSFGGTGNDLVAAFAAAPDGSLLIAGNFDAAADLDPGPAEDVRSPPDVRSRYVSKVSSSGTLTWARVLAGDIVIRGITADTAGAVYVAGAFNGEVDFDPGAATVSRSSLSGYAAFLLKLGATGNFTWVRTIAGTETNWTAVSVASDGSIWTAGIKGVGGATLEGTEIGRSDLVGFVVTAFEASGNVRVNGFIENFAFGHDPAIVASSGVVHIGASLTGNIDFDLGTGTATRAAHYEDAKSFVATYDLTGAYRDAHQVPDDVTPDLAAMPGGGVIAGLRSRDLEAFRSDGVAVWSLPVGTSGFPVKLTSSGTAFVSVGYESTAGDVDMNPGAGVDVVAGPADYFTHYSF